MLESLYNTYPYAHLHTILRKILVIKRNSIRWHVEVQFFFVTIFTNTMLLCTLYASISSVHACISTVNDALFYVWPYKCKRNTSSAPGFLENYTTHVFNWNTPSSIFYLCYVLCKYTNIRIDTPYFYIKTLNISHPSFNGVQQYTYSYFAMVNLVITEIIFLIVTMIPNKN